MNKRYYKLIQYKAALDAAYKKFSSVELFNNDYEATLQQVKMDGYKVMRNSNGDHKIIDIQGEEASTLEMFNELFGGLF